MRISRFLAAAALATSAFVAPAYAQQPPAAPAAVAPSRCGGVLCDLYYSGRPDPVPGQPDVPSPTALPCRDMICGMFTSRDDHQAVAPTPAAMPEPAQAPEPVKKAHRKKAARVAAKSEAKTSDVKTSDAKASDNKTSDTK